ncbi:ATP-binding protein [Planctomycetota bacterium]
MGKHGGLTDTGIFRRLPEDPDVHIQLKARYQYIRCMRDMCESLASRSGFNANDTYAIKLTFDEVLTNAFLHGCDHPSDDVIDVYITIQENGIYMRVRDPGGKRFDYRKYKNWRDQHPEGIGTGLALLDEFADGWTVLLEEGTYTEFMFYRKKTKEDQS